MRVFVALVPPPEAVEHLEAFLDVRRDADADLRWSRPEQWHVTLAFAADVRERVLDDLVDGLSEAAGRRPALDLAVAGGGAFPDAASARVLYAGLVAPPGGADDVGEQAAAAVGRDPHRVRPRRCAGRRRPLHPARDPRPARSAARRHPLGAAAGDVRGAGLDGGEPAPRALAPRPGPARGTRHEPLAALPLA
ncbi:RNA 2',3'-cyclic phosphodiesterase [Angustibacter aerolatus]|uniref:RNA 2',3'-cyclic phosphodiesterase n=1 Tax=Angustibacter aerolatus TaxID=1162965 RepID=A0ABQ6JN24_9ACTN|nr:2'-5' RNA ligase family protein [Angustibacter aerolatus]GMA88519.1 RNA 2',3'-cyclic phosphodiesterase [Angustibacter aerolatus]